MGWFGVGSPRSRVASIRCPTIPLHIRSPRPGGTQIKGRRETSRGWAQARKVSHRIISQTTWCKAHLPPTSFPLSGARRTTRMPALLLRTLGPPERVKRPSHETWRPTRARVKAPHKGRAGRFSCTPYGRHGTEVVQSRQSCATPSRLIATCGTSPVVSRPWCSSSRAASTPGLKSFPPREVSTVWVSHRARTAKMPSSTEIRRSPYPPTQAPRWTRKQKTPPHPPPIPLRSTVTEARIGEPMPEHPTRATRAPSRVAPP